MASLPAFFLAAPPGEGPPRLLPGEAEHALRVLRLGPGDRVHGLDGEGQRWELEIVAAGKRDLGLRVLGPPETQPAPGEEGAPLPFVEVAVSWPRKARAEAMIARLVQLGVARITPLVAAQGGAVEAPEEVPERWLRVARDACKQCGRVWMPQWGPRQEPRTLAARRADAPVALLDLGGGMSLDTWLRSLCPSPAGLGTRARPVVLAVGPEGGFTDEERTEFLNHGATTVEVAPHILRIETAAEAAMAVAGAILMRYRAR